MNAVSHSTFWSRFFTQFRCAHCGGMDGFVSRPRNWFERRILRLLSFRPARCGDCYHRSYRPLRVPLLPHPEQSTSQSPPILTWSPAPPNDSEPKGTQKGTNEGDQNLRQIA
jgi:hypothetical protein